MASLIPKQTLSREFVSTAALRHSTAQPAAVAAELLGCITNRIRALIVDDQSVEREVLRYMLKREPDIEVVGTPANGREAVEAIRDLKPDLVFLDVQMPELDGFGVVSEIGLSRMPVYIFVTADREFAVKAFDARALDYLLKPIARCRLQVALQRAREQIRRQQTWDFHQRLSDWLSNDLA